MNSPRNPVILVHGITDTAAIFNRMTTYLEKLGHPVHSLDLIPANGDAPLDRLAEQLAIFIDRKLPKDQPFDLVGFSMGGLVSRYYVQRLGGIDRVQRFITISSPHKGTLTAYASRRPGCVQMRPNSAFLNDLDRDIQMLDRLQFTSIWTPMDLMILPALSSAVASAQHVQVNVSLHAWMVTDGRSLAAVATALQTPIKTSNSTQTSTSIST